jgi:aminoglycoside 2'-N-acetyltransferase I
MEIHLVTALSPNQREEIAQWFQKEFGHIPYQWAKPNWYVLTLSEDKLISCLGILERVVAVDGQPIQLAGIGSVMTHPEWRGRGIASALLEKTAAFIRGDLGVQFGLLLCRKEVVPLYAKLGWKLVEGPTIFDQPTGKMTYPRLTMVLPCGEKEWPTGPIDLCGLPW